MFDYIFWMVWEEGRGCAVYLLKKLWAQKLSKNEKMIFFHYHWGQGGNRASLHQNAYLRCSRCKSFLTSLFFSLLGINKKFAVSNIRIWIRFFMLESAKNFATVPRIFLEVRMHKMLITNRDWAPVDTISTRDSGKKTVGCHRLTHFFQNLPAGQKFLDMSVTCHNHFQLSFSGMGGKVSGRIKEKPRVTYGGQTVMIFDVY